MRNKLVLLILWIVTFSASAQSGDEVFSFLRLPNSTRANALGGHTVALVERDPSLIFHNPGLLGTEMDGMINLNYMNYISDINVGSAVFTKAHGEQAAWGVGATFISYGDITEVLEDNTFTGSTLSAQDISISGFYARDLNPRWRGGVSLKFLYSHLADYTSIGLCVDVGLSYYNSDKDFSFGFVFKNIGAQLKAYQDDRQKVPWDIQMGITQRMAHAPVRLSLTAQYLRTWNFDYTNDVDSDYDGDSFFKKLAKHFIIGVDFIPSDNFWVGIGFNPKVNMDMKASGGGSFSGFSGGAGIRIKMFDVGFSVAKYHPSATSLMISVSTTLEDFK